MIAKLVQKTMYDTLQGHACSTGRDLKPHKNCIRRHLLKTSIAQEQLHRQTSHRPLRCAGQ